MSDSSKDDAEPNDAAGEDALDVKSTKVYREWKHGAPLLGCRFDPTGRFVFASSMDQSIQRWDLEQDQHATFSGHESWLRGIGFSADGRQMFSGGYDGRLCFWDRDAQPSADNAPIAPFRTIQAHDGWIRWLAVHPAGDIVATAGNDLLIKLWSADSGDLIRSLDGHQKHIYSLLFHFNGNSLFSGDLAGVVHQWDLATGELLRSFDAKPLHTYHGGQQVDYGGVRCMALSKDASQIAFGGLHKATNPFAGVQEPLVLVFDLEKGEQIRTHEATEIPRGIVWRLVFEQDGTLTSGIGGEVGYLVFWKTEKNEFHKLRLPSPVLDMDRHPRKPEVVTAHHDGRLRISRLVA